MVKEVRGNTVGTDLSGQCNALVRKNVQRRVLRPFFDAPINNYD